MKMKRNMGLVDREIRASFALVFLGNGLYFGWGWAIVLGAVLVLTAIAGICPIYRIFRTSTVGLPVPRL